MVGINSCIGAIRTLKFSHRNSRFYSNVPINNISTLTRNKTKKKINIVKKSFLPDNTDSPVVLETKEASSVIKRLNWEFKHLYGPLRNLKSEPRNKKKVFRPGIFKQTQLPILKCNLGMSSSKSGLGMVLDFPLRNVYSKSSQFVCAANSIREDLENRCSSSFPSVSRILQKTMPEDSVENLRRWKENMIKELGEEGFERYHAELLAKGTSLHASINSYLTSLPGEELDIEEINAGHWKSLKAVFPKITEIKLLEEPISHQYLGYQGIVDCFAHYRDHLVVIDWKTSKKFKTSLSSTFDNPLQIAAYVGALNFNPRLQYTVNKGLIVVAYESGAPATELFIDDNTMEKYWQEWLKRVKMYWEMTESEKSQNQLL